MPLITDGQVTVALDGGLLRQYDAIAHVSVWFGYLAITTPVRDVFHRELSGPKAWAPVAQAWELLELDSEDLNIGGSGSFGSAVDEKHGDEHPAVVAARMYTECCE